ncbi:MAG: hypothetical protein ACR2JU_01850 [Nocardioidaceae bacterium]
MAVLPETTHPSSRSMKNGLPAAPGTFVHVFPPSLVRSTAAPDATPCASSKNCTRPTMEGMFWRVQVAPPSAVR